MELESADVGSFLGYDRLGPGETASARDIAFLSFSLVIHSTKITTPLSLCTVEFEWKGQVS